MKWKYGFVTFERAADAYKVIDTSSKNPVLKDYDISFGGRRAFCREKYLDLGKCASTSNRHLTHEDQSDLPIFSILPTKQITQKMITHKRCIQWRSHRSVKMTRLRRFCENSRKNYKTQRNENSQRADFHRFSSSSVLTHSSFY